LRIAITGVSCISALGHSYGEFSDNLLEGYCGVMPLSIFDHTKVRAKQVAEVKGFVPGHYFDEKKQMPFLDRFAQFALVSAREALASSGLSQSIAPENTAVVIGTGIGGQITQDDAYKKLYGEGAKRFPPFLVPKLVPSSAASHISIDLGITGASFGITSSCASAGHAICTGAMMLITGQCDAVLCGGAEAPITLGVVKAWEGMRVLSPDYCRPFSAGRGGVILGEAGATLVMEPYEKAQERGAPILAELVGYGMSSDASHFVSPNIEGPAAAMRKSLTVAGLAPEKIDYINAHGSGTQLNDVTETAAIKVVFGRHANHLAISSTKAMHGHTLGAASALEAAACLVALERQVAPGTFCFQSPDPECDLNYLPNASQSMTIDYAMSNSFAFGGLNTSLIFKRVS